jgi:hypothetical protein
MLDLRITAKKFNQTFLMTLLSIKAMYQKNKILWYKFINTVSLPKNRRLKLEVKYPWA